MKPEARLTEQALANSSLTQAGITPHAMSSG